MNALAFVIEAGVFACALAGVVHLLLRSQAGQVTRLAQERRELLSAHNADTERWTQERRELLNRIQRPEYVPMNSAVGWVAPEQESDEMALVGTINYPDADDASD